MADTTPAHSFQVKDEKQMKATHPASQENVDYLTCPAYVIQNLATQQNLTWIVLCACHARDGGNGGGWLALGHCTKKKAPLQEAGTGEEEPSKALGVPPLHCDVLQALVAPPHAVGSESQECRNRLVVCSGEKTLP